MSITKLLEEKRKRDMQVHHHDLPVSEILRLVARLDPVFLELGAAHGDHTQQFLATFTGIRLFCFEPDLRKIEQHKARISDPRCSLIEAGASDEDGEKLFYMSSGEIPEHLREPDRPTDDWDMSSSFRPPKAHLILSPGTTFPETYQGEQRRCMRPTIKLNTWWRLYPELDRVDFVWADTQGSEGDILTGASDVLPHIHFLYTEFSNKEAYEGQLPLAQLREMLSGFDLLDLYGGNPETGMESNALFKNTAWRPR